MDKYTKKLNNMVTELKEIQMLISMPIDSELHDRRKIMPLNKDIIEIIILLTDFNVNYRQVFPCLFNVMARDIEENSKNIIHTSENIPGKFEVIHVDIK